MLILFHCSCAVRGQYRAVVLNDQPVFYWPLDDTHGEVAAPLSGGLNGNYRFMSGSRGIGPAAASLLSDAARIEFPLSDTDQQTLTTLFNGSFTIELWLLDEAAAADGRTNHSLLYKADTSAFPGNSLWLYRARQNGRYCFRLHGRDSRTIELSVVPSTASSAGDRKWHHLMIAVDRSRSLASAWLDGELSDHQNADELASFENSGTLILGNNHHHTSPWAGSIDEVAVYSTALQQEHATAHFRAGQFALQTQPPPMQVSDQEQYFELNVRPLLIEHCLECHSAESDSPLQLDSRQGMLSGGDFGPSIIPGRGADSLLVQAVRHTHKSLRMPPDGNVRLTEQQIRDLEQWIDRGAVWGRDSASTVRREQQAAADSAPVTDHWAFSGSLHVVPPEVSGERWTQTNVDRFLQRDRLDAGVSPGARADRYTLIRRATFDLTGLPPTAAEVSAFLDDARDDGAAFADVVDRLLASEAYGVRQGRLWLDVARYADTQGDVGDFPIPAAWLYRNWVIDAFNSDLPFDEFLQAQIAGDLLAAEASDAESARNLVIATGFVALAKRFGNRKEDDLHQTIEDTIDTIGRGILGLTLRCARCHDHKFDPLLQTDYYALYGIFSSTRYPWMGMSDQKSPSDLAPVPPSPAARRLADEYWTLISRYEYQLNNHHRPWLKPTLDEYRALADRLQQADAATAEQHREDLQRLLNSHSGRFSELMLHGLDWLRTEKQRLAENPPVEFVFGISEGECGDSHLHRRGDPATPGAIVTRGVPAVFGHQLSISDGSGRRELARWLTRKDHPLTPRVFVNRIWAQHFGGGIVPTLDNFGSMGAPPGNRALLDWLAERFVTGGWSVKQLHRELMLTETYQLESAATADPALLQFFPRRRLQAEEIRDAIMAVSGTLDQSPGESHPFKPWYSARYSLNAPFHEEFPTDRRSVYLVTQRLFRNSFLGLFDAPDRSSSTSSRGSSSSPPQALYLMNSPFMQTQSRALAERTGVNRPDSERIDQLFRLAYGRLPSADERLAVSGFLSIYRDQSDEDPFIAVSRSVLTSNEFFFVD